MVALAVNLTIAYRSAYLQTAKYLPFFASLLAQSSFQMTFNAQASDEMCANPWYCSLARDTQQALLDAIEARVWRVISSINARICAISLHYGRIQILSREALLKRQEDD